MWTSSMQLEFRILSCVLLVILLPVPCFAADDASKICYTSGGVAGIVIATVVVTIVMGGLALASLWYIWKQKLCDGKKPGAGFFGSSATKNCSLDGQGEKKPLEGGREAYAFDNPYFKDDEVSDHKNGPDAAEKGMTGFKADNGDFRSSSNNKIVHQQQQQAAAKTKKNRPFSNIQFPNVFHQGSKKPRAMDDTCLIPKPLERVEVPLRGHDFTGLGFNICGNMRDGIFVKDVLHRGPASESGKIKAGDRIVGVTVSFGSMVYEDALTILSYASPYDVRLELEKRSEGDRTRPLVLPVSSPSTGKTRVMSSSFRTGQRLFHPLYRSQSIDDLTQIGKETGNHLNKASRESTSSKSESSNGPKRSQSIEGATKPTLQIGVAKTATKGSRQSSTSSHDSLKKSDKDSRTPVAEQAITQKSASPLIKSSVPKETPTSESSSTEKAQISAAVKVDQTKNEQQETNENMNETKTKSNEEKDESSDNPDNSTRESGRPTPPPRKAGTHQKRKAPAPPSTASPQDAATISAIVHWEAEKDQLTADDLNVALENDKALVEPTIDRSEGNKDNEDLHNLEVSVTTDDIRTDAGTSCISPAAEDDESANKRKASSLDDLTKIESGGQNRPCSSSPILERAVSLDLQQTLPDGNLEKQKMNLETPVTQEDKSEVNSNDTKPSALTEVGNLKKWEGTLVDHKSEDPVGDSHSTQHIQFGFWPKADEPSTNVSNTTLLEGLQKEDETTKTILEIDSSSHLLHISNGVNSGESLLQIISTPIKKSIVESPSSPTVDDEDKCALPLLDDQSTTASTDNATQKSQEETSVSSLHSTYGSSIKCLAPAVSPITLVIPVIKPDISQFEILSSPTSGHLRSSELSPMHHKNEKRSESERSPAEEREDISVEHISNNTQSLHKHKAVFKSESLLLTNNSAKVPEDVKKSTDTSTMSSFDIVNGNGNSSLEFSSSSFGHFRTTSDKSPVSDESLSVSESAKDITAKKHFLPELSSIKVHSGVADFAKTLIIATPTEGETLSLSTDLDSPPPTLESPPPQ